MPVPLQGVDVAERAFVTEAAALVEVLGSGTPSRLRIVRCTAEAATVVGKKTAQNLGEGSQIAGSSQTQFAGEAIMKSAPEAFDAALLDWGLCAATQTIPSCCKVRPDCVGSGWRAIC